MLGCVSQFVVSGITMAFATKMCRITRIKDELSEIKSLESDLFQRLSAIPEQLAALEPPCPITSTESEVT